MYKNIFIVKNKIRNKVKDVSEQKIKERIKYILIIFKK